MEAQTKENKQHFVCERNKKDINNLPYYTLAYSLAEQAVIYAAIYSAEWPIPILQELLFGIHTTLVKMSMSLVQFFWTWI